MSSPKVLFGFHAVGVRLKTAPKSIVEIYFEPTRRDARMRQFIERVKESGVRLIEADGCACPSSVAATGTRAWRRGWRRWRR
jgi:23S rRNA (guanosine2251-2'-O)-methyltransferase